MTAWRVRVRVTLPLAVYRQSVRLGAEPLETHGQSCFSQLNTCGHSLYIISSLTRGWVWDLQLLLVLASAFILWSESPETRDRILLSQIEISLFVASYYSRATVEVFDPSSTRELNLFILTAWRAHIHGNFSKRVRCRIICLLERSLQSNRSSIVDCVGNVFT
jgi:hypothetical protein